jgi:acyl carrier protein/NAD-dependent dihydropyrimidine dehydrogenase PreA subunit
MIADILNKILENNGLYDSDDEIQEKLLSEMNSLRFIQLVVAIENEFNIGIPDEYLLLKNFRKRDEIVKIIELSISSEFKSVSDIVEKELCIGCLACVQLCPHGELEVCYGKFPYPVPIACENCDECGNCLLECPAKANEHIEREN